MKKELGGNTIKMEPCTTKYSSMVQVTVKRGSCQLRFWLTKSELGELLEMCEDVFEVLEDK